MRALSLAFVSLAAVTAESGPKFDAFEDGEHSFQKQVAAMYELDGQDRAVEATVKQAKSEAEKNAAKMRASVDDFAASLEAAPAVGKNGRWMNCDEALGMEIEARQGKTHKQHKTKKILEREAAEPLRSNAAEQGSRDEPAPHASTTAGPKADKLLGSVESLNAALGVGKDRPAQWTPTALHPARPKNQHSNEVHIPTVEEEKKHAAALKIKLSDSHPHRSAAAREHDADRPSARSVVARKLAARATASSAAPAVSAHQAAPGRVTYDSHRKAWVSEAEPRREESTAHGEAAGTLKTHGEAVGALKKGCHWGDIFC